MENKLNPRLMILAASIAGLMACNPSKQVKEEQNELSQTKQEMAQKQHDLNQEQAKESAELMENQRKEIIEAPNDSEHVEDRAEERADMMKEHAEEQADLQEKTEEKINAREEDLAEAKSDALAERDDAVADSRERLKDYDQRAQKLSQKLTDPEAVKSADDRVVVSRAMDAFPKQRQAALRDIEHLTSVAAVNFERVKKQVDRDLSAIDETLDRVESVL